MKLTEAIFTEDMFENCGRCNGDGIDPDRGGGCWGCDGTGWKLTEKARKYFRNMASVWKKIITKFLGEKADMAITKQKYETYVKQFGKKWHPFEEYIKDWETKRLSIIEAVVKGMYARVVDDAIGGILREKRDGAVPSEAELAREFSKVNTPIPTDGQCWACGHKTSLEDLYRIDDKNYCEECWDVLVENNMAKHNQKGGKG